MNAVEPGPVLEDAPARHVLAEAAEAQGSQLRHDGENRFRFRREVERVAPLVIVEPVNAVAVVEQLGRLARAIDDDAMKSAVQPRRERAVLLTEVHQIVGGGRTNRVTAGTQPLNSARRGELLS